MHLERSMVAQLGNVPQPEQLGSSGSAGSGGELGTQGVGQGGGEAVCGGQGEQSGAGGTERAEQAVGASVVVRLSSPSSQTMGAADIFDLSDPPPTDRSVRRRTTPSPKPGGIRLHSPMVKTAR